MKIYLPILVACIAVVLFIVPLTLQAQTSLCPAGYTCTPVVQVSGCPTGFVCTPVTSNTSPAVPSRPPASPSTGVTIPVPCYNINPNTVPGSTSGDVGTLQTVLINKGFDIPAISQNVTSRGYFGSQTQTAVKRYQAQEGLTVTGVLDTQTISRLNSTPCPPLVSAADIVVVSPKTGGQWIRGSTQTITWQNKRLPPVCPTGANCSAPAPKYYDIRLSPYQPPCTGNTCAASLQVAPFTIAKEVSSLTYTWSVGKVLNVKGLAEAAPDGRYTMMICQSGTSNCSSSEAYFDIVASGSTPSFSVRSPNGGETWQIGTQQTVSWGGISNIPETYRLWIRLSGGSILNGSVKVLNPSSYPNGTYTLTVPDSIFVQDVGTALPSGQYKLKLTLLDGDPCVSVTTCNPNYVWGKVVSEDTSDATFTITSGPSVSPTPTSVPATFPAPAVR